MSAVPSTATPLRASRRRLADRIGDIVLYALTLASALAGAAAMPCFIPVCRAPGASGTGLCCSGLILTIMIVPITASICRELFLAVPTELEEGALALGTTRWEMVRGVILPATRSGIAAATILGLGRALGEAIAVTQVIGGGTKITANIFGPSDTIASKI